MSLLVDTNVVSELLRRSPNPIVENWMHKQDLCNLYLSAISESELRYGAAVLDPSKRQQNLISRIDGVLLGAFLNRILPFDTLGSRSYAHLAAFRRSAGRLLQKEDCQVAAVAHSNNMTIVTRNVRDFEGMGIELINPWLED